jgi:hypothetical protein
MTAIFLLISTVFCWTAGLPDWSVAYATGLAQLGIWSTLLSLVPFVSAWVFLKSGEVTEIPQSMMRTHWVSSLKISFVFFSFSSFIKYN